MKCPKNRVQIERDDQSDSYRLTAKKPYKCGEVVYSNKSIRIPHTSRIIAKNVLGKVQEMDPLTYTVNRGPNREFFFFDSFQNHSCSPNTVMKYTNGNKYDIVAIKPIKKGEEITTDYASFDNLFLDNTTFTCTCGQPNCRRIIRA
jgi:hypothetical protein